MDGISKIVLENVKLPSEKGELIIPFLRNIEQAYCKPIALVHDMGQGILSAVKEVFPDTPDFICHFHFLLKALDQGRMETPSAPAFVAYAMVHWSFAISVELEGYGFPFDCPHWIFYQRLKRLYEFINHFENYDADNKPLRSLWRPLTKIVDDPQLKAAATRMEERTRIFEKLRKVFSIAMPEGGRGLNNDGTDAELQNIEAAIMQFCEEIVADEQLSRQPVYKKNN
jgi:hypothetical protein